MDKKLFFLLFALLTSFTVSAQKGKVTGILWDTLTYQPISAATVTVFKLSDSSIMNFTFSENNGSFVIKDLPVNIPLRLLISHINYTAKRIDFMLPEDPYEKDFDSLLFAFKIFEIEAVEINWEKPPILIRGDTISFQADAFLNRPGTVVEDLLKRIPGIEFNDNGITMNGQSVNKILLDGKEFFGSDPTMLLKNIPSMMVDKVQVTEEKDKFGRATNSGAVTINVTLKPEAKKGSFGKAFAGYGTTNKYEVGTMWNVFRDTLQVSFIGYGNNLSKSGFSFSDLYQLGGFNRTGYNSITYSDNALSIGNTSFGGGNGLTESYGGGVNLNHILFKKLKVNASYFYGAFNTTYLNTNVKDFLFTDSIFQSHTTNSKFSRGNSHSFNLGLDYIIDSTSSIYVSESGAFSWQRENSIQEILNTRNYFDSSNIKNKLLGRANNLKLNGELYYDKMFSDKFSLSVYYEHDISNGNSNDNYDQLSLIDNILFEDQSFNQISLEGSSLVDHQISTTFYYDWNPKLASHLVYNFNIHNNSTKVESEQKGASSSEYMKNAPLSGLFKYNYQSHQIKKNLRYKFGKDLKSSLSFELGYELYDLMAKEDDRSFYRNSLYHRPTGSIEYRRSGNARRNNLSISLDQNLRLPSFSELLPILSNLDPMKVSTGNYQLEPVYTTGLSIYCMWSLEKIKLFFYYYANSSLTQNPIMRNTFYDEIGREINTFQNLKGRNGLSGYNSFSISKKIKLSEKWELPVSFSAYGGVGRNYQLLYGELNSIFNQSISGSPTVRLSKKDVFELSVSYGKSWSKNEAKLTQRTSTNVFHTVSSTLWWQLPKGFSMEYDYKMNYQPFISSGIENAYNLLSISINKRVLKEDRGIIKLSVFDLLKQNTNISRVVSANYIGESQSNTVVRYFMLSFVYNLNTMSAKEKSHTRGRELYWW